MFGNKNDKSKKTNTDSKNNLMRWPAGRESLHDSELRKEKEKLDLIIEKFCADLKKTPDYESETINGQSEFVFDAERLVSKKLNPKNIDDKLADLIFFRLNEVEKKNKLLEKELEELRRGNNHLKDEYRTLKEFTIEKTSHANLVADKLKNYVNEMLGKFSNDLNKTYERQIAAHRLYKNIKDMFKNYVSREQLNIFCKKQEEFVLKKEMDMLVKDQAKFATKIDVGTLTRQQAYFSTRGDLDNLKKDLMEYQDAFTKKSDLDSLKNDLIRHYNDFSKKEDLNELKAKQGKYAIKDELPKFIGQYLELVLKDKINELNEKLENLELRLGSEMYSDAAFTPVIDESDWAVVWNKDKESCT